MKILGLIPARGGSKGVPRKNVRLLNGKPLLVYTAEAALKAKKLARVVLSTEDEEIARIGENCGLDVPFMRPPALARDDTPTLPVIFYTLTRLQELGENYDAVCLLQPTNPLRRAEDIDGCAETFEKTGADSVVSVRPVPAEYNPKWIYWSDASGNLKLAGGDQEPIARRQDLPPAFHRDGSIYVTRSGVILERRSLYGDRIRSYVMPPEFSVNIDTEQDWEKLEREFWPKQTKAAV
jgi:CMP-N-acetylneuraminic acid synthetase